MASSTRVKGITIEIGADSTGLSTALSKIDKEINSTQKSLRDVNKLLELDPSNTELLAQKQKLLSDAVSKTAEKLEAVKEAAQKADEALQNGEINQSQYDALKRELVAVENEYSNAKKQSDEFNNSMSAFNQKAESVANAAGKVAEKTKAISAAAGVAAGALIGLGFQAAAAADDLLTMSQQTGMSTDILQGMQQYADLLDVDFNDATSAVTKLKKSLSSSEEVFAKIGVEVKNQKGEYRDINTIFFETLKGLANIENETERDTAAMEIFGRSADQLAGYIDDGGAALQRFIAEGKANGSIVSDETLESAKELNDLLDLTKQRMKSAFGNIGMKMAESLVPVMNAIANAAEKLAAALNNVPQPVLTIITVILLLVAAIAPVAIVVNQVAMAVSTLGPLFSALGGVLGAISSGFSMLVAAISAGVPALTAVVGAVGATVAVIGLVAAAVALWVANWDEIKEAARVACEEVGYKVQDLKNNVVNNWNNLKTATKAAWDAIKNSIATIMDGMPETIGGKIKYLAQLMAQGWREIIQAAKDAGKRLMDGLINSIKEKFSTLTAWVDQIKSKFNSVASSASSATSSISSATSGGRTFSSYDMMANNSIYASNNLMMNSSTNDSMMITSAIDELARSMNNQNTNVTVTLQGDARGVFKLVRQENNRMIKSTGFHALA